MGDRMVLISFCDKQLRLIALYGLEQDLRQTIVIEWIKPLELWMLMDD